MESKKPFKQVTIKEAKEKKEARDIMSKFTDELLSQVDLEVDKAVVDFLHELGYTEAVHGMSLEQAEEIHAKLNSEGMFLNISKEISSEGFLVVKISLVQTARELAFRIEPTDIE